MNHVDSKFPAAFTTCWAHIFVFGGGAIAAAMALVVFFVRAKQGLNLFEFSDEMQYFVAA
jgi:hypothetical protein